MEELQHWAIKQKTTDQRIELCQVLSQRIELYPLYWGPWQACHTSEHAEGLL